MVVGATPKNQAVYTLPRSKLGWIGGCSPWVNCAEHYGTPLYMRLTNKVRNAWPDSQSLSMFRRYHLRRGHGCIIKRSARHSVLLSGVVRHKFAFGGCMVTLCDVSKVNSLVEAYAEKGGEIAGAWQRVTELVIANLQAYNNARDEICPSCKSTYVVFDQHINKYRCLKCPHEWGKLSPIA